MATDQRNLPAYFSNDADFQTWVAGIHAQLLAVGLVNTSDTGQINPATVTKATTIHTAKGYEIWRFNDTLQATAPVFIKVEYGSGSPVDEPDLWVTVGTGSNGAGTLTGQVGVRKELQCLASKSAGVTLPSYFCSDGSGLVFVTNYDNSDSSFVIACIVDRTRDGAGSPTADGIFVLSAFSGSNSCTVQVIPTLGTVPAGNTETVIQPVAVSPTYLSVNNYAPGLLGINAPVVPLMTICGKLFFIKMAHLGIPSTVTYGVSLSAATLGGTHTLLPVKMGTLMTPGAGVDAFMMLWE